MSVGELYLAIASDEEAAEAREIGTTPGRLLYAGEMLGGDSAALTEIEAETVEAAGNAVETSAVSQPVQGESAIGEPGTDAPGEWTEWARRPVKEIRREHERRQDLQRQGRPGAGPSEGPMTDITEPAENPDGMAKPDGQGSAPEMNPQGANPPEGSNEMNMPDAHGGEGPFEAGVAPFVGSGNAPEMNPEGVNQRGGTGGMNGPGGSGGGKPF